MGGDCKQGLGSLLNINTFDFSVCFPASHLGPTGDFRVATGCGCGPIKGSESPFATEVKGLGVGEGLQFPHIKPYQCQALTSTYVLQYFNVCTAFNPAFD
jgi:hypothetical protein